MNTGQKKEMKSTEEKEKEEQEETEKENDWDEWVNELEINPHSNFS